MMNFPKIKIELGYSVKFDSKNTQGMSFRFFSQKKKIEAEIESLREMFKLGQEQSEYKMSTRREINISITF
jgi:hypothetical protein